MGWVYAYGMKAQTKPQHEPNGFRIAWFIPLEMTMSFMALNAFLVSGIGATLLVIIPMVLSAVWLDRKVIKSTRPSFSPKLEANQRYERNILTRHHQTGRLILTHVSAPKNI